MSTGFTLRDMGASDYPQVRALWEHSGAIRLGENDTEPAIARYLERNPGLSTVAATADRRDARIVGSVLCGHDGRWGMIRHLSVAPDYHDTDAARLLVDVSCSKLARLGYKTAVVFIPTGRQEVIDLWRRRGWTPYETTPLGRRIG